MRLGPCRFRVVWIFKPLGYSIALDSSSSFVPWTFYAVSVQANSAWFWTFTYFVCNVCQRGYPYRRSIFMAFLCRIFEFSVCVKAFVIWLSEISSFLLAFDFQSCDVTMIVHNSFSSVHQWRVSSRSLMFWTPDTSPFSVTLRLSENILSPWKLCDTAYL